MMADNVDAAEQISTLLDNAKYKEALAVPSDDKHLQSFKNNCGDVLTTVIGKIKDDTALTKPSLQSACEELLNLVVQKASPEEALLEFIEQTEIAKNDAQFCIILSPLQQLLKKLSAKRGMSLEWCLNSISTYIENIPIPEYNLEDKERLLMDCDPNVRRIIKVYSEIPTFYSPFVKEMSAPNANVKTKQIVTAFLISLLGKPLIYLDLDPDNNATSEARKCCATIVQDICIVEKNVLKFLIYLENCSREKQKPKSKINNFDKDHETPPYEQKEKVNMDTLSGLFYAVFSGHFQIPDMSIPQVYSSEFIVNTAMYASLHFLSFTEFGPLTKAVALAKVLLGSLPDNLPHSHLSSIHVDLLKKLTNVAIYSVYQTIRKNAVNLIGFTVNKFEYKGRCLLIKCLLEMSNHSGMMGYATTLYKNSIDEAFKSCSPFPDCLSGAQLLSMLKKMCHLPHGPESDIVELADQIITTLNFLRYLALKDVNNVTGITECFSYIESQYLEKLRVGLNMSKAHYEVKLKDIEDKKVLPTIDVSINVGGNPLDNIPTEQKKEIIHSALNAFHLIEGLVARVSECININKLQGLTMDCA